MSRYEIENELNRAFSRPREEPIKLLAVIRVVPVSSPDAYAARLRFLVHRALKVAEQYDFEEDDIPTDGLPEWFLAVTTGAGDSESDSLERRGRENYVARRSADPWDAEEWIYCFDPDLRAWSWWDITADEYGNVCVWVDTKGEAHIPCEELWWAVYAAGAEDAAALTLEHSDDWRGRESLAVSSERP